MAMVRQMIRQVVRPLYVAPNALHSAFEKIGDAWETVAPLVLQSAAIEKAKNTAKKMSGFTLSVNWSEQKIGFVRLFLTKPARYTKPQDFVVDIYHQVHFRGHYCSVPNLCHARQIKFKFSENPIWAMANPTEVGSYLIIDREK